MGHAKDSLTFRKSYQLRDVPIDFQGLFHRGI